MIFTWVNATVFITSVYKIIATTIQILPPLNAQKLLIFTIDSSAAILLQPVRISYFIQ